MTAARFDIAWSAVGELAQRVARQHGLDLLLIRDVMGRATAVLNDKAAYISKPDTAELRRELVQAAGPFAAPDPVVWASDLFVADEVLQSRDTITVWQDPSGNGRVRTLERGLVGSAWHHTSDTTGRNRVVMYSFKGGVGRSTAAYALAQHFAVEGRCVLVVDLDLESPGIGALLARDDDLPAHGIVDHLVESAVGNEAGLELVTKSREIHFQGNGEVWLAPAGGRPRSRYDYLAKLNRSYLELPPSAEGGPQRDLGSRLEAAIEFGERQVADLSREPDVTLLDCRAGIHDIAAVAITRLADLSLLFATDNRHTWNGYRMLFEQWGGSPESAQRVRERLRMVAALVPRASWGEYLSVFRDNAQDCFARTLYDDVTASVDPTLELFNPAVDDDSAPHSPLPIEFIPELVGRDLTTLSAWYDIAPDAYSEFLNGAADLVLGEPR